MSLQIWFWVLYVLTLIGTLWMGYVPGQPYPFQRWGGNLLQFILIGLLGWQVFGAPVK